MCLPFPSYVQILETWWYQAVLLVRLQAFLVLAPNQK